MSVLPRPSLPCARAREWSSLRLDGELSQLESAMLESHLARCAACHEVVFQTEAFTTALRASPLEALRRPIAIPRAAAMRAARVTAAAAVMLVAAGLGSVFATSLPSSATQHAAPAPALVDSDDRLLRDMRRDQLRIERAMLQTNSRSQIGHVI
jgi:ferric-dicitrate binding protein FerR (iron transport regulator)